MPSLRLETDLTPRVALWDATDILPSGKSRYPKRPEGDIRVCFFHHSGATGKDGYDGLLASTRYVVRKRGWSGCPYTFWVPRVPDVDESGRMIVYRCNRYDARSWHTGRNANGIGIAVCFQGNLSKTPPTEEQFEMAAALVQIIKEDFPGIEWSFHSEADWYGGRRKKACPGPFVESWVRGVRCGQ